MYIYIYICICIYIFIYIYIYIYIFKPKSPLPASQGYQCVDTETCPDGVLAAAFVLVVDFSEFVYSTSAGAAGVANSDFKIWLEGGVATVARTFLVERPDAAPGRRRLQNGDLGTQRVAVYIHTYIYLNVYAILPLYLSIYIYIYLTLKAGCESEVRPKK